jgi:hypothetical protein
VTKANAFWGEPNGELLKIIENPGSLELGFFIPNDL